MAINYTFKDAFKNSTNLYREAVNALHPMMLNHPEEEVRRYRRLTTDDFIKLYSMYGRDAVDDYIAEMNSRLSSGR